MAGNNTYSVLRNKFPESEYVLMQEVSDRPGGRNRSMDYMLVNIWESRGLAITGIEVKSFRSDWLRELKDPQKQEKHFKYCDYFYLLTDQPNVAYPDEIPTTWGHWHINEKGILKTIKKAPILNPIPVDRALLVSMLRRAQSKDKFVHVDTLQEKISEEADRRMKQLDWETKNKLTDYERLRLNVAEFEKAAGVKIDQWYETYGWGISSKDIGKAMKFLLKHKIDEYVEQMRKVEGIAKGIHKHISDSLLNFENESKKSESIKGNSQKTDSKESGQADQKRSVQEAEEELQ